jgi:hypothetical protein
VGVGVVLADELSDEPNPDFLTYHGVMPSGDESDYYVLHPVCFLDIFNELIRQQSEAAMFVGVAVAGNIREALALP